jgi:hypothetical protein
MYDELKMTEKEAVMVYCKVTILALAWNNRNPRKPPDGIAGAPVRI